MIAFTSAENPLQTESPLFMRPSFEKELPQSSHATSCESDLQLAAYLRDIGKFPLLDKEQEHRITSQIVLLQAQIRSRVHRSGFFVQALLKQTRDTLPLKVRSPKAKQTLVHLRACEASYIEAEHAFLKRQESASFQDAGELSGAFEDSLARLNEVLGCLNVPFENYQALVESIHTEQAAAQSPALHLMSPLEFLAFSAELEALHDSFNAHHELLVLSNLKLVVSVAKSFLWSGMALLDLIQEGNTLLTGALKDFDPSRNCRLSTFLIPRIHSGLLRAVQNYSRVVRLPSHVWEKWNKLRKAQETLLTESGEEPSAAELSQLVCMPAGEVCSIRMHTQTVLSIHQPLQPGEKHSLEETLTQPGPTDAKASERTAELKARILGMFHLLDATQKSVLTLRLGLDGKDYQPAESVAHHLGLHVELVSQIETQALKVVAKAWADAVHAA